MNDALDDRPRQGSLQVRRDGIQEDGLLGARLRAQGHRHHRAVPGHAAGRRRSDRGLGGGRRQILDRDLDGGVDRPADGGRKISRQMLPRRSGAEFAGAVFRLYRLRSRSVRARLDRQPVGLDHRQRVRLQAAEGAAARGHAAAGGLREDVPGAGDRHRGRARAHRQVRPAAARRHREAEARPVRPQLRPRGLRGAEGRARLHQGRREHQLAAVHALARALPLLHGGGQQGAGRVRRDQGHLSQRHRRHHGGHVRARRVRQGTRLGHRHDRSRDRLHRDPVDGEVGAPQRHDPASASRRSFDLYAAAQPRRLVPRHREMDAARRRRSHPCRHRGRQARRRSRRPRAATTTSAARTTIRRSSSTACSSTRTGRASTS